MDALLPAIPAKRYFTIGEVSDLCAVKPHVLRYWEQEFNQLKPMKRRGNRRYYQHHEVLMIRRIRDLLYDQGFTISGARNKLHELAQSERNKRRGVGPEGDLDNGFESPDAPIGIDVRGRAGTGPSDAVVGGASADGVPAAPMSASLQQLQRELREIRELLSPGI